MEQTNGLNDEATIQALREYSTCDVSDALQSLGLKHGGFIVGPTMQSPRHNQEETRIVGPAYTVKYSLASVKAKPTKAGHYIDNVPPGAVVLIDAPQGISNAVYGGMMSRRAKARHAVGTVVRGRMRDLKEHLNLQYAVFAQGLGTASPYDVVKVTAVNEDLELGDDGQVVRVRPGDYIVGDANGVVCLPCELANEALEIMASMSAQDAKVAADLEAGVGFVEASSRHRTKR